MACVVRAAISRHQAPETGAAERETAVIWASGRCVWSYRQPNTHLVACSPARALAIKKESDGEHHFSVGHTLYNMACLHMDHGKLAASAGLMRQSLEIYELAFGPDHQLTVRRGKPPPFIFASKPRRACGATCR